MNVAGHALLELGRQGPLPTNEVVRAVGMSAGHVRRGLHALVVQGLAERGALTRLGHVWSLTDEGRAGYEKIVARAAR